MIDFDINKVQRYIEEVENLEINNKACIKQKEALERDIERFIKTKDKASEDLDIVTNAVTVLRIISDDAVQQSYKFIQESVNNALERVFSKSVRKIKLEESTIRGQYPQLEIVLYVEGGKTRSLKTDSGHGLMQMISLLCILSLIVITGSRRLLVLDEVLSGLSVKSRMIVCDILWTFTSIDFQFVLNEHGLVPAGSNVIHLETVGGVSYIKQQYISKSGTYLDGKILEEQGNNTKENEVENEDEE